MARSHDTAPYEESVPAASQESLDEEPIDGLRRLFRVSEFGDVCAFPKFNLQGGRFP